MKIKFTYKTLFILLLFVCLAYLNGFFVHPLLINTQKYEAYSGNIKGNVNTSSFFNESDAFEIGANQYGYAVFKNPVKAFAVLRMNYGEGIRLIQSEFHLLPLSQLNYKQYKTYGWQVSGGTREARQQASFVTRFLDIYENSYEFYR